MNSTATVSATHFFRVASSPFSLGSTRDMKCRMFIAFVSLILMSIGILPFYNFSPPVALPRLTVSFLAFTNDSSGADCSAFVLSNSGPQSIYRISSYRITGPSGTDRDTITNRPLSSGYMDRILRPGDSEVILVSTPVAEKAWRARFDFWIYRGWIGSVIEDWMMGARRTLGMKVQDIRQWGTGASGVITEQ